MNKVDTKYLSTSGLATKSWGPSGWMFLFSCIMGGYPPVIDNKNPEHLKIKKHFKNMFESLGYTMPCVFCRDSFKVFYKELPIDKFLSNRIELMRWLYLIRNKVNEKLIQQEIDCYNNEKKRLKIIYYSSNKSTDDKKMYYDNLKKFKSETFCTKKSPPFKEVLDRFENIRATCSKKAKTCALPKK